MAKTKSAGSGSTQKILVTVLTKAVSAAVAAYLEKRSRDKAGKARGDGGADAAVAGPSAADLEKEIERRVREELAKTQAEDGDEPGNFAGMLGPDAWEAVRQASEGKDDDDAEVKGLYAEIDRRVKKEVAKMNRKEEYQKGDLKGALAKGAESAVLMYTGKESYAFGDITMKTMEHYKRNSVKKKNGSS
jgi:hypothetical protein